MPVRIYDIAKRLKIESKAVLAKALELGINSAKKPSSSLDKITAEYLVDQIEAENKSASSPESEAAEKTETSETETPAKEVGIKFVTQSAEDKAEKEARDSAEIAATSDSDGEATKQTAPKLSKEPEFSPSVEAEAPKEDSPIHGDDSAAATEIATPTPKAQEKSPSAHVATAPEPVSIESVQSNLKSDDDKSDALPEVSTSKDPAPVAAAVTQPEPKSETASSTQEKENLAKASVPNTNPDPDSVSKSDPEPQSMTASKPDAAPEAIKADEMKSLDNSGPTTPTTSSSEEPSADVETQKSTKPDETGPRVGEKVGFINLSGFGKPAPKGAKSKAKVGPKEKDEKPRREKERPPRRGERDQGNRGGRDSNNSNTNNNNNSNTNYRGDRSGFRGGAPQGAGSGMRPGASRPIYKAPALPASAQLISMKAPVVVRDLASAMHRKPFQVIADLMELKVIANVNQAVDEDIARQVCAKHGFRFEIEKRERGGGVVKSENPKRQELDPDDAPETLKTRPPVVTIMGHVDHGKTTLLDTIRKTNVVAKEAGGITQHIGAYTIEISDPENKKGLKPITFLDTPGHAAFSAMRARGANVTDIVVLVVAASEGVLPQTVEALSHAKAAGVPIIVAVNKCDHPNANPTRIRQQMQERDQLCEEWGGSTIFQDVSALTGENVDKLLELILLQAEILELKANPNRRAVGNIIESGVEAGGPTATFLVRKGTLKVGDVILCDNFYGKARALIDESGARVKEVGPSTAVKVLGLNGAPDAGAQFIVVESDKLARQYAEETHQEIRLVETERKNRVTLENLFQTLDAGSAKMLKVVVKADTQGSVEAIVEALGKIHSDKVSLMVIHDAVGTISESDVLLCSASNAIILGFHTRLDKGVPETAKREGVQIKTYAIIYELIEEVKQAMAGLLDPIHREVTTGAAEIRQVFSISKSSNVAGCMVSSGKMNRGRARLVRKENTIYTGMIGSLRRFQDEVNEVRAGMECGIRIDGFDQFEEGDVIECFALEEIAQEL